MREEGGRDMFVLRPSCVRKFLIPYVSVNLRMTQRCIQDLILCSGYIEAIAGIQDV